MLRLFFDTLALSHSRDRLSLWHQKDHIMPIMIALGCNTALPEDHAAQWHTFAIHRLDKNYHGS